MSGKYILDKDGKPEPCDDINKWGAWFETADRHLLLDKLPTATISTVFLGLDHSFSDGGEPILWETMVFGGKLHDEQERYTTQEDAIAGHRAMVDRVRREG